MDFNIAKLQTTVPRRETLSCCKNPLFLYQSTTTDMLIPGGKKEKKKGLKKTAKNTSISFYIVKKFIECFAPHTCLLVKSSRLTTWGNLSLSLCSTVSTLTVTWLWRALLQCGKTRKKDKFSYSVHLAVSKLNL